MHRRMQIIDRVDELLDDLCTNTATKVCLWRQNTLNEKVAELIFPLLHAEYYYQQM